LLQSHPVVAVPASAAAEPVEPPELVEAPESVAATDPPPPSDPGAPPAPALGEPPDPEPPGVPAEEPAIPTEPPEFRVAAPPEEPPEAVAAEPPDPTEPAEPPALVEVPELFEVPPVAVSSGVAGVHADHAARTPQAGADTKMILTKLILWGNDLVMANLLNRLDTNDLPKFFPCKSSHAYCRGTADPSRDNARNNDTGNDRVTDQYRQ
jgi:hypothetical protein